VNVCYSLMALQCKYVYSQCYCLWLHIFNNKIEIMKKRNVSIPNMSNMYVFKMYTGTVFGNQIQIEIHTCCTSTRGFNGV